MITEHCIDTVLPVVANNWRSLRKCDVHRLLNQFHYMSKDSLDKAGEIIVSRRDDLRDEVADCIQEIAEEYGW